MNILVLDIKTIISLLVIGNFAQIAILIFYRNISEYRRPYWQFTVGKFLQAIAWLLLDMRGAIPDLLSAYIGNTILLYGFALETFSLTTVGRLEKRWGTIYFSIATVGIAIFWIFASTSNLWVGYASLTTMTLFLVMSVSMACAPASSLIRKIIGLFYGIAGLALAARAWSGFFSGSEFALMSRSLIQTIAFAATFLTLIVGGIGFLLLFKEQADKLIDESEKKYRTLVERANESICIIQEGRFVFTNGKLEELLGVSQDNLIGRSFTDFIFQDDMEMVASYYESRGEGRDIPDIYNFRVMNHEGKPVWVQISSTLIEYGGKQATLALISNINRRKLAEEALNESEEKFRLAFNHANSGMCLVDCKGNLLQVNDKMTEIFGYSKSELERMTVNDLAISEDMELSTQFMSQAIQGISDNETFEKRYCHHQGHIICCLVASSLVHDAKGQPLYFISQVLDITERKLIEAERERLISDLQSAIEQIKTLRGIVPICANCKKIRDDKGYWQQVEAYVSKYTEAKFSHGICPDCMTTLYPEYCNDEKSDLM
jgi:PAS domain S-box-containing protein